MTKLVMEQVYIFIHSQFILTFRIGDWIDRTFSGVPTSGPDTQLKIASIELCFTEIEPVIYSNFMCHCYVQKDKVKVLSNEH
ncbi:hypothetical protein [Paraglaciecola sp.]|uniref:hypothetical protein n=1 Tax=Paraglaciecola sp. TaxID=1920173 RepID=UPI0032640EEB